MFPAAMVLAFYLHNPGDIGQMVPGLIGITLLRCHFHGSGGHRLRSASALWAAGHGPGVNGHHTAGKVATGASSPGLGAVVTLVALTFTGVPASRLGSCCRCQ